MKIFSAVQLKEWDKYTITHEPVSSLELMERAAGKCYKWLADNNFTDKTFKIFCGTGNNGGDGLAIARMLIENKCSVSVYVLQSANAGSDDFKANLEKLNNYSKDIHVIEPDKLPTLNNEEIIIDALYGTGLNKPPAQSASMLIDHINSSRAIIIAIDVPSGLYIDKTSKGNKIIKASFTLSFQQPKLAFMMAENEPYFGKIILLDINLHPAFYRDQNSCFELTDIGLIKRIYKPRKSFSNKGDFGNAYILAGSYGMMGAAILAARACLKSGAGKLTSIVCKKGYEIMQVSVPEAMCKVYGKRFIKNFTEQQNFNALGIGPGIGLYKSHKDLLFFLFKSFKLPMVIDADALNIISQHKELLSFIPEDSILTPHPKEFERLFGKSNNDFERMELAIKKSQEYKICIVLKGHHTLITSNNKTSYFNSTGNPGMAKGGSGDVLTGMLTGLIAQGYTSLQACLLGVYLHGMAGDIAAEKNSQEAMIAGDIINAFGEAYNLLEK